MSPFISHLRILVYIQQRVNGETFV